MRNSFRNFLLTGYKTHTQVTRVIDGGEPSEFKSLFKAWKDKDQAVGFGNTYTGKK